MRNKRGRRLGMVAGSHGCLDDTGRGAVAAALGIGEPRRILVITMQLIGLDEVIPVVDRMLGPLSERTEIP
jgi:hypothetical protein